MAELADAADSKSADPCGHGGSTPPPGTMISKSLRGNSHPIRVAIFVMVSVVVSVDSLTDAGRDDPKLTVCDLATGGAYRADMVERGTREEGRDLNRRLKWGDRPLRCFTSC